MEVAVVTLDDSLRLTSKERTVLERLAALRWIMFGLISNLKVVALTGFLVLANVRTAWGQASGTFPGEPFNGMQITYSISGANVSKTTDTPGFTWQRAIQGALASGELRVTGKAVLTNGYGYTLRISVQAGSKTKSADFNKKVNEESSFDVSVPIGATAANGSVQISMTGNYNAGTRGVVISAYLSQMAPVVVAKKPKPGKLGADARLKMILDRFMGEIRPGNFGSGMLNNIASVIPFTSRFDSSICGNYQAKVLALLDSIRWSSDPDVRSLMDGFDYGPIQSLYGGHQAVAIYAHGKDWMTEGIVLDPWIEQKAKYYAAPEWAQMYSFGAGSYYGIGGSTVYEAAPQYPTVGGSYVNPNSRSLTPDERNWVQSLPEIDRDRLKAIKDPNLRQMVVKNGFVNRKLTGIMVVNCPVDASVVNRSGQTVGFIQSSFVSKTNGATVDRVKRGPDDWFTLIRFDPAAGFRADLRATGNGSIEVVVGHGMDQDDRIASRYLGSIRKGEKLELSIAKPKASLVSGVGLQVPPTNLTDPGGSGPPMKPSLLFDNNNLGAVNNGPTKLLWLTFERDVFLTQIETYHWNSGKGTRGGTMSIIEKSTGRVVGTWPVAGASGMNGVPNANWSATPNILLPKGSYRVECSSNETWSFNSQSKDAGFVRLWGRNPTSRDAQAVLNRG